MKYSLFVSLISVIAFSCTAFGNPREAKDLAVGIAKSFQDRGYIFSGISHVGRLGGGGSQQGFSIPVENALEYALVVGSDVGSILVTVTDDSGKVIVPSKPANTLNGVQFRSPYKGVLKVDLTVTRSNEPLNYLSFLLERNSKGDGSTTSGSETSSRVLAELSKVDSFEALNSRLRRLEATVFGNPNSLPGKSDSIPQVLKDSVDGNTVNFKYPNLLKDGFYFLPEPSISRYKGVSRTELILPVSRGGEYVILVAVQTSKANPAVYTFITDDRGGFLTCSAHSEREFSQRFTASYSGTAKVYIELTDQNASGALVYNIGRRAAR